MLNSLEIRNFRNLKELKINSLGNVNLITGKNNTGKSTLLEAVAIYAAKGDLNLLYELMRERDEKGFFYLFYDRKISYQKADGIFVGVVENKEIEEGNSKEPFVAIQFVKYQEQLNDSNGLMQKKVINDDTTNLNSIDYRIGLEITSINGTNIFALDAESHSSYYNPIGTQEPFQFVRTVNTDKWVIEQRWGKITLTDKENYVNDALKIIDNDIERIALVDLKNDSPSVRTVMAKHKTSNTPLPLKSMGDGINRILTIILALVNADNGYLLIDEFENGLHHSVQEKLWEIIFYLSKKLNVQVFATTHSEDCIRGFEEALNGNKDKLDGKLIRLDLKKGIIKPVEFNAEELKIVSEGNIEIR